MRLRIRRHFKWVNISEMYGGPPQWSLEAHDVLQYQDDNFNWFNVPVVEDDVPLHPDQQKLADSQKEFQRWLEAAPELARIFRENEEKQKEIKDAEDPSI